jgi:alkyl hydroperoxide reductase subunit F|tara:strand:- start:109 stop:339 length:231 start_codon:yes stop_codon:yes gene_type:complete
MKIEIYTKTTCPYSTMAKQVLELNSLEYTETVLDDDDKRTQFYESCGDNVNTVPQIFVDGERLGGFQHLLRSKLIN